jgi:hypothetical protein
MAALIEQRDGRPLLTRRRRPELHRRGRTASAVRARCRPPTTSGRRRCAGRGRGYAALAERMFGELVRITKPGGRVGVIVRAIARGCWINLPLDPALKTKVEMPGMIGGGMSPGGCADASLYQRFHALGLKELHCFPQLVAVRPGSPRLARYQQQILAALSPAETEAWRRAVARADCEGGRPALPLRSRDQTSLKRERAWLPALPLPRGVGVQLIRAPTSAPRSHLADPLHTDRSPFHAECGEVADQEPAGWTLLSSSLMRRDQVSVRARGGKSAVSARRAECSITWSPACA